MPRASPAVLAFNGGEASPRLEGRVDLDKYDRLCKRLENFLPLVQGGVMKRSGFRFVTETKVMTERSRLVRFIFNSEQAYILEFGGGYIRFYRDDGAILEPAKAISNVTNATPAVVTSTGHGFVDGDEVFVEGTGIAAFDGRYWIVNQLTANTFELVGSVASGTSSTGTASRVYEIASPYAEDELRQIQYTQSADVLYLAHPLYAPRKLSRAGHTDWTLETIVFDWQPFSPENTDEDVTIGASAATGTVTLTSPTGLFTPEHVGSHVKLREVVEASHPKWIENSAFGNGYEAFIGGGTINEGDKLQFEGRVYELVSRHGATDTGFVPPVHEDGIRSDGRFSWRFVNYGYGYALITAIIDEFRATATVIKELPRSVVSADLAIVSTTAANPVVVTSTAHGLDNGDKVFIRGVATADELNDRTFTVANKTTNTFELLGEDGTTYGAGTGGTATQYSWALNSSGTASNVFYPSLFRWSFDAWSEARGFPRTVCFFEDRLDWGGTRENPQTVWMSRPGLYEDHRSIDEDDSALVVTLSSEDAIEWSVGKDVLLIGTGGSVFATNDSDEGLVPGNIASRIKRKAQFGSRPDVAPVLAESVLLFAVKAGQRLRELVFDDLTQGYLAPDMTRLADHIALGLFQELAFQAEPDRLLWATLEDGSLICFTYERSEQVTAWHRHPLGGTDVAVESIAVVPHSSGSRDQLWAIVSRTIDGATVRYVEFLEQSWIRTQDIAEAFFVDSGLSYDGSGTAEATVTLTAEFGEDVDNAGTEYPSDGEDTLGAHTSADGRIFRVALRFPTASIPLGATITQVRLRVQTTNFYGDVSGDSWLPGPYRTTGQFDPEADAGATVYAGCDVSATHYGAFTDLRTPGLKEVTIGSGIHAHLEAARTASSDYTLAIRQQDETLLVGVLHAVGIAEFDSATPPQLLVTYTTGVAAGITSVSGLDHLEGESVAVLADGVSVGPFTVTAGAAGPFAAAMRVHAGLPYTAALETLRLEAGGSDGTSRGHLGRVTNVVVLLDQTGAGLFMGPTVENATQEIGLPAGELTDGETTELPWPGGYDRTRRLAFKHTKPLPCTITAAWPKLATS